MDTDHDPLIGSEVSAYTVERLIGEGGMGRVYEARHTRLQQRRVALKILLGDLAAALPTRLRFTQEAEAASRLDHPNVVAVSDFGRTDAGLLYLTMELVNGRTLASVIAEGALSPPRVVALARQLAAGLAHAHGLGFVHRDFKPENVLVVDGPDGEVPRIVDFGLAIAADPAEQARLTHVGTAVGTPLYAAPEQIHGGTVDHRSDLFGLGVTMFEMLAGRLPYDGNLVEIIQRNSLGNIPAITDRNPDARVPAALEALVRSLMAPLPAMRVESAAAVIEALDRLDAAPPDVPRRVARSRTVLWGSLIGAAVVVAVLAVLAIRAPTQHDAPVAPTAVAPTAVARAATMVQPMEVTGAEVSTPASTPITRSAALDTSPPVESPEPPLAPERRPRSVRDVAQPPPRSAAIPTAPEPSKPAPPVVEPAPPAAPPVVAPPVEVPRAPAPSRPPAAVATRAAVRIDRVSVTGPLTTSSVERALDRALPAIRACYVPAAASAQRSPALALAARLVIDENRSAGSVQVADASLGDLSTCVTTALRGVRADSAPDVGVATVNFVVRFTPELP